MSSAAVSVSVLIIIAGAALLSVGVFTFQHRARPGARGVTVFLVGASCWSLILGVNIHPVQVLPAHVSMALRNGLILVISLGWLLFVLEYIHRERIRFPPVFTAVVLVIPVLTVLVTLTNPLHHLALGQGTPDAVGGGPEIEWGPWHLVFMTYLFVVLFFPVGLLAKDFRSSHGIHRRQLLLVLAGFVVALLGANDYLVTGAIDGVPSYVRISPFAFLLAAGLFGLALFRHQLFEIVPISRRTVVETVPDPVIVVDDSELLVDLNPAATVLFNVDDDATGTPFSEFCDDYPTLYEYYRDGVAETKLSIHDGETERYFSVTCTGVGDDRQGTVMVLRDITPLKERERQLTRQNERLDQFASMVSHDLRNPLNAAIVRSQLLAETSEDEHHVELEKALARMDAMIDEMLTLARAGIAREETEEVNLQQLVTETWEMVQTEGGTLEMELNWSNTVQANPDLLQHVFENLFRNAIEHNDSPVTVRVGTIERPGGFYVEDDGGGLPEDGRDTIFEHGYTTNDEGAGLGLTIVRDILDGHGWEVKVTDSNEGGTRFEIYTA